MTNPLRTWVGCGGAAWGTLMAVLLILGLETRVGGADVADRGAGREVRFKERGVKRYWVESVSGVDLTGGVLKTLGLVGAGEGDRKAWVRGTPVGGDGQVVEWGSRVVLELEGGMGWQEAVEGLGLSLARTVREGLYILQAPSAEEAMDAAEKLSERPGVRVSVPVMRRALKWHGNYAAAPGDRYFTNQWHLEHRGADLQKAGPDLNVRSAWGTTRGQGVRVAIVDTGVQLTHPDLASRLVTSLHYNFYQGVANGNPYSSTANHGTSVAGLVAATAGNDVGVAGVAPEAGLASWVIFGSQSGFDLTASTEQLMAMFQRSLNEVQVQNHSWGSATLFQQEISALEDAAIEKAVKTGRGQKGVILVRAAGNSRRTGVDANDDGYSADPRSIAVGAVRRDGRVCSYSNRGASVLVSAPSGDLLDADGDGVADGSDPDSPGVYTTDRTGSLGYSAGTGEVSNYFDDFNGTSASAPQIAGLAALALSANTNLTYRDVQYLLLLSARHFDLGDPDVRTNGAGLKFSHNVGYGVPDAGTLVELARIWPGRPALARSSYVNGQTTLIPDDSFRLRATGLGLSATLTNIRCLPSLGLHPDVPTKVLPLVYVGLATSVITQDLRGKAALIQRGTSTFADKIQRVADAGAELAVIFNNVGTTTLQGLGGTDFSPIPAVSLGQTPGGGLRTYLATNAGLTVQTRLNPVVRTFNVTRDRVCEYVGVRIKTTHTSRQDVRITLVSPSGHRSVLQRINQDGSEGPVDWTYWSAGHFLESAYGVWRVEVSDERNTTVTTVGGSVMAATGSLTYCELIITGVDLEDTDHDGLSDAWERERFGDLSWGAAADPDGDGWNNAQEQVMGTDPAVVAAWVMEMVPYNQKAWRLSWPMRGSFSYTLWVTDDPGDGWSPVKSFTELGAQPEWVVPRGIGRRFFKVTTVP